VPWWMLLTLFIESQVILFAAIVQALD